MTGYTKNAQVIDEANKECYAKESGEQAKTYYIRVNRRDGLFDPNDIYGAGYATAKIKGTVVEQYPFIKVSKETFDLYILFLKTGNRNQLLQANRTLL